MVKRVGLRRTPPGRPGGRGVRTSGSSRFPNCPGDTSKTPRTELAETPVEAPEEVVQVDDKVVVVVTEIDRERRSPALSRRQASTALD
ncbi:S1 RNA-binding domain-containing protein [Streptomyces sp. NPDC088270]|uniref:S1 RNA-binding domain-containing protein n=1 Tax=unclassified Streptomyces TaxID=2593676 RepID=UPI003429831A